MVESRFVQIGTQKLGRRNERDVQVKIIFRIAPCKPFWMRLYQLDVQTSGTYNWETYNWDSTALKLKEEWFADPRWRWQRVPHLGAFVVAHDDCRVPLGSPLGAIHLDAVADEHARGRQEDPLTVLLGLPAAHDSLQLGVVPDQR